MEVYINGEWGTVCDDGFGSEEGEIICRQLGLGRLVEVYSFARFGEGGGPIHFDDLQCDGTESQISYCKNNGVGVHNCRHGEDVSVFCNLS